MARLGVDMARHACIHQHRTPGGGNIVGMFVGSEGIVAAGNCDCRKRQGIARIGTEGHQMFRPDIGIGDIRWRHQKRACNLLADFRKGVDDGRHTQRMGDDDNGLGRGVNLFHQPRDPVFLHRF